MGGCPPLTPMFPKRKKDGEITLQWLRSITSQTHTKIIQVFLPVHVASCIVSPFRATVVMTNLFLMQS